MGVTLPDHLDLTACIILGFKKIYSAFKKVLLVKKAGKDRKRSKNLRIR